MVLEKFKEKMKAIGTGVKYAIRGAQGLPPEDDIFSGLIDVNDIRERTRLPTLHDVYGQEYLRLLGHYGGDEWKICKDIADLDGHLFISLEGEQRKEAILMQRSERAPQVLIPGQGLEIPRVCTAPPEKKEGKNEK